MRNQQKFEMEQFRAPDISCASVYIWVWNDVCTRARIDEQLSEMQRLGIRAFYILPEPKGFRPDSMPTNLTPDYLSEDYFALCAYAIEKGGALGMRCWIYDEGGWPSGGACGQVLRDHPEYARQTLKICERAVSAGEVYQKTLPDVLAAFLPDQQMIAQGQRIAAETVIAEYSLEQKINGQADYPDLLNKDATEYFLKITHEGYARAMAGALGKTVTAVFTDEPKAPARAFNQTLAGQYETLYGESVLPYLPLIAGRAAETPENARFLQRWYDLCSRMFCAHFLLPCKKWANAHGMAFTGHLDKDHDPLGCVRGGQNFNLMRALRCMDIPGVDVIWRQIYPECRAAVRDDMQAYNGFYPRYASSAAAQIGTKSAMAEVFGVAGPGLTYEIMRFTVGYLAVRGVNIFNLFNFPLGRKGALLAQELPVFTAQQTYCRDLGQFNRYMERLSYVTSLGERVCETCLYYPVLDFQGGLHAQQAAQAFDALGRALEERMIDFDIADDDVIRAAAGVDEGCLRHGSAVYRHIVIPASVCVPADVRTILDRFTKGGGKVVRDVSGLRPEVRVEGDGLRVMRRKTATGDLLCLFRERGESGEYRIHLPAHGGYLPDLMRGTLQKFSAPDGVLALSPAIGETVVILLTEEALPAETRTDYTQRYDIPDDFRLRRAREQRCDENGFVCVTHKEESVPVRLGDWADCVGAAYAGSGVYETTFSLPAGKCGKAGMLDLGDVRYTAAVTLNGRFLETVPAPPYRVKIPEDVLRETNTLQVVVTNTDANWYLHTDYFDKWSSKELSPYFEGEKVYAADYASGGLYGPVALYTQ